MAPRDQPLPSVEEVRDLTDAQLRSLAARASGDLLDEVLTEQLLRRGPAAPPPPRPRRRRQRRVGEDDVLLDGWQTGRSVTELAEQLATTPEDVRARIEQLVGPSAGPATGRRRLTPGDLDHLIRRRRQRATKQAIATELGVSVTTVRRRLRALRAQGRLP